MKRLLFILPLLTFLLACCTPHPAVPEPVEGVEGVEGPFQASPALSTIDSLMWQQPDSAFTLLLQFAGSPEAGSLDTFNLNYFHVLLSELFYKNNCAQSNRNELLQAVASFDSLSSALNAHPLAPSRHSGPDPESPSPYDDLPFLAARAHYINGVGYYESDSLVPACAEYLKALEVMEDHYKEKELVGHKARFMAYTFNRLGDMFSGQYMMKPAIECYENALVFCRIEPTSPRGVSNILSRLGLQYDKLGDKKKMRDYYQKALEEMPDSNNVNYRDLMAIIALCNYQLGAGIEKPMNSLKETLEKAEDESERLTRYITIGDIYYEEGMYDSALYYLEQVFDSTDDIVSRILVAEQLYVIYGSYGDHDQADGYAIFLADSKKPDGDNKAMVSKLEELYKTHTDIIQESNARKAKGKAVRKAVGILLPAAVAVILAIVAFARKRAKKQQAKADKILCETEQEYEKELQLMQAARDEAEREMEETEKKHQLRMTEVKTRHEKELRLLKDKSEKEIEDEQKKYAKDLETERLSFQKKQDSLRQELQKREARIDVLEKALIQRRKNAEIQREAFLNEPICRQILDLVHEKTFTTRDNSYDIGIALKDKDFTQLKRAVEKHYEGFDNVLLGQCPDLNRDLLILCHLHLLGLDEKQIAALRNLTYGAILKQNERFMEKLGVNDDVGEFVLKVAEGLCGPENDPQDVPQGVAQGVAQGSSNEATQANLLILLDIVSNNPEITREEMAKQLGVSKKTIERYLKKLGNRVRYVGSGYSGHWEVD